MKSADLCGLSADDILAAKLSIYMMGAISALLVVFCTGVVIAYTSRAVWEVVRLVTRSRRYAHYEHVGRQMRAQTRAAPKPSQKPLNPRDFKVPDFRTPVVPPKSRERLEPKFGGESTPVSLEAKEPIKEAQQS